MRDLSAESWIAMALVAAIIAIPVAFAIKDSPSHWHVTASSLWGTR